MVRGVFRLCPIGVRKNSLPDHAPIATQVGDIGPTPAMGQGFGLGFAVRTAAGHSPLPGSVGSFYRTGAWGRTLYVDPKEKLVVIMMIQMPHAAADTTARPCTFRLTRP
jgi:CubicO group peptidase (beta-lactamase class C family)